MSSRSPVRPATVAGDGEGGDATRPRAWRGAGEDRVDVGVGRVGDPGLGAVEGPAVTVGPRLEVERAGVTAGAGLRQGEARHDETARDRGQPLVTGRAVARLEDRVGAQPLQGQRGLGLGVDGGERLPEQAQLHRRRVARGLVGLAPEQPAQQAELAHPTDQRAVHRPVHRRDVVQGAGHAAYPGEELLLLAGQAEGDRAVGRARRVVGRACRDHAADHTVDAMSP